jgi:beta-galactosidase/beta-glucuronidase
MKKRVMNTSIAHQVVLSRLESLNRREFLKSTMAGAAGTAFLCWSRSIEAAGLPLRGLEDRVISLSGKWAFELDPQKAGSAEGWFNRSLADSIQLPGTLDERGKGPLNEEREIRKLTRVRNYSGPAWFQREIDIPKDWSGRRVLFTIERTKTASVWIDDRFIGKQDSLTVEHTFDLGKTLQPGPHRLIVCEDNSERPPVGDPHQLSDETQTNWNGLLGRIELRARDAEWIESIRTFPDVAGKRVRVVIELGREPEAHDTSGGKVRLSAKLWNVEKAEAADVAGVEVGYGPSARTLECVLPLGAGAKTWDEFSPALYRLRVELDKEVNGKRISDLREIDFGLREFSRKGTQFSVNGRTVFLRGKHDACVFPLTGYAPMSVDEWVRVLRIAKSYGINHYRFHSWCPPDAAFAAADIVGIYMQPELPNWQSFGEPPKHADGDVESFLAGRTSC